MRPIAAVHKSLVIFAKWRQSIVGNNSQVSQVVGTPSNNGSLHPSAPKMASQTSSAVITNTQTDQQKTSQE